MTELTNNPTYFDLLAACQQPGCPVCRLVQTSVERYLGHLFYESVNDGGVRAKLRASLGFCHEHAWLLQNARIGDALGMAIIYHDVLGNLLKRLPLDPSDPARRSPLQRLQSAPASFRALVETTLRALTPQRRCLACEQRNSASHLILSVLAESLEDPAFFTALKASDGLCLPHLRQALDQVSDSAPFAALLSLGHEKVEKMHAELAELIRKNDYRFRQEGLGPEGDSWKRVVPFVVGNSRQPKNTISREE